MSRLGPVVWAAALTLLAAGAAAQSASDGRVVRPGEAGAELTVSGQVNRMVNIAQDGAGTEVFHVDNDASSTRLRLLGRARIAEAWHVGSRIEVQFESNSSAKVSQDDEQGVGPDSFTERKIEAWIRGDRFGELWIGQGDPASRGATSVDLSRTAIILSSGAENPSGGLQFRDDNDQLSGITIGQVFDSFGGLGRDDRLRYDSPKFAGFHLSGAAIADGAWDLAGRFTGGFGGIRLRAVVGYGQPANSTGTDFRLAGSASALHQRSGLSLTAAFGIDRRDDRDPQLWHAKLGWQTEAMVGLGTSAFAVAATLNRDVAAAGDDALNLGAAFVQRLKGYGTELYLGLGLYRLDRPGIDTQDLWLASIGTRIKF